MWDAIARMLTGLRGSFSNLGLPADRLRWWEYPLEPVVKSPTDATYTCNKALGSPSVAGCEAALYEFIQPGLVTLDPSVGPLINIAGTSN